MARGPKLLILIVIGVLAVNYAYLHDVIWQTHDGFIFMGWKTYLLALVGSLVVVWGAIAYGGGR